jgi:hypothetical protein
MKMNRPVPMLPVNSVPASVEFYQWIGQDTAGRS